MNFRKAILLSLLAAALPAGAARATALQPRLDGTATLLPDGNILFTGGVDNTGAPTNIVQVYDMKTASYVDWTGLSVARSSHTATLMSDGRVLIAGGFGAGGTPLSSLEICDPAAGSCSAAGLPAMFLPRGGQTATLLSGGQHPGQVLICGGQTGAMTAITNTCDLFDPVSKTVTSAASMTSPRIGHTATLVRGGNVFVSGGRQFVSGNWAYNMQNEMYYAADDIWKPVSSLLQGRVDHTATVLNNGLIMIAGGYNAANQMYCDLSPDSLKEDCWHIKYYDTHQYDGTQGYIDGAEFFDQQGGLVTVQESTYGSLPYRMAGQSAVLGADGAVTFYGGYGNIYPTFFLNSPSLTTDSMIYLSTTGATTATINGSSVIKFPLDFSLSRAVSGRLNDADLYISPPPTTGVPSIQMANAQINIPNGRVDADGLAVGLLLGKGFLPGEFSNTVALTNPAGTATFLPQSVVSGKTPVTTMITSTITLTQDAYPGTKDVSFNPGADITSNVSFSLPYEEDGAIIGSAVITSGEADSGQTFSMIFNGGSADFYIAGPASCDTSKKTCLFSAPMVFTNVSGTFNNLTSLPGGTTFYAADPIGAAQVAGVPITLNLTLNYAAEQLDPHDTAPAYVFDQSTMVVRGMVFSSEFSYYPDTNKWSDLTDTNNSPVLSSPTYHSIALYTPADDTIITGGENCETATPLLDCRRAPYTNFYPTVSTMTFIPKYISAQSGSDTWTAGPNLNSPRAYHTSTLLPDGSILTCGGSDGVKPLASCEIMDPLTKKWAATTPMNTPRSNHTATLLPNGDVLVAGGVSGSGVAISSAEIFYPDTQRWVLTSPMAHARQNHTATLLPDGNVLVTGGDSDGTYSATAEIYITSAAYWADGGLMTYGRAQHTATLLKSGQVLITGGLDASGPLKKTELYNYSTRSFAPGPDLGTARYDHTATLLRDGNVVVIGGSDGIDSLNSTEIYYGTGWTYGPSMIYNRANHRALLLPNGKVMVTGGEMRGIVQIQPEIYDPDFRAWITQGSLASGRTHHTSVMTRDNKIVNIGGWSGSGYLNTTDIIDFSVTPDVNGLTANTPRQPQISTGTQYFDWGGGVTLQSGTSNFFGITEASGGGAASANSSFSNPRLYMQQIDNPSGFLIDLSTRIYNAYGGLYGKLNGPGWDTALSSITVVAPSLPGEMPHGWYMMRVADNGQFSDGHVVQVTLPRPEGTPSKPTGTVNGTGSVNWVWDSGSISLSAPVDGYAVYAATDDVFIATVTFPGLGAKAYYTQAGLVPNTAASIKVAPYNQGGTGSLSVSDTYYTLAAVPSPLAVTGASFETARLEWSANGNTAQTIYEVSMSPSRSPQFSDPLAISTPVPFSVNYMSTSTVIAQLSANQPYDFRVRAMNNDGKPTAFTNYATTVTVSAVTNFTGQALDGTTINWSWAKAAGADHYELYDVTAGTQSAVQIASTTADNATETGLQPNMPYYATVLAVKDTVSGPVYGPFTYPAGVYTLTVQPSPAVPNIFTGVSTGAITANWITNGNSTFTVYDVNLSTGVTLVSSQSVAGSAAAFTGLSANVKYSFTLQPYNGDGVAGTAVDLGYKYTLANVPASLSASSVTMSGIGLLWDTAGNSDATVYEVRGSTSLDVNGLLAPPIETYVHFSQHYTSSATLITGLLTATTYYFDVAACNGEALSLANCDVTNPNYTTGVTAHKRAAAVYTLSGPPGAPPGSVGGTSNPSADVTISGVLPNDRTVSMLVPEASFQQATPIAISSASTDDCGFLPGGVPVGVDVYSQAGLQPQTPVTLTLTFDTRSDTPQTINDIINYAPRIVLARYNPVTGQCLPLETAVNVGARTITATLNHFSHFQLALRTPATNLSNVIAYPNPFYTNRGEGFVTIDNIPADSKVRIYTLSGDKVWESPVASTGMIIWKGVNKSGYLVASGIYLAVIDSSEGKKILKLAVER